MHSQAGQDLKASCYRWIVCMDIPEYEDQKSQNHKLLRLEKTFEIIDPTIKLAPPSYLTPSHIPKHPHVFLTLPGIVDHITSLRRLLQNLTTLCLKKFFIYLVYLVQLEALSSHPFFFLQHWVNLSWPTSFWHSCVHITNTVSPTHHPSFLDIRLCQVNFNIWCSQRIL